MLTKSNSFFSFLKEAKSWLEEDEVFPVLRKVQRGRLTWEKQSSTVDIGVIDVSPSMDANDYYPTRLDGAKQAFGRFLDTLLEVNPCGLVGLVKFSIAASIVCKPVPVQEGIRTLKRGLDSLSSELATNIGSGLNQAASEIDRVPTSGNRRIILLTDGESNFGRNPKAVAEAVKAKGIQLDIIGIGGSPSEVNERDLKQMASVVNGELRYWFIKSVGELVQRFETLALREVK